MSGEEEDSQSFDFAQNGEQAEPFRKRVK